MAKLRAEHSQTTCCVPPELSDGTIARSGAAWAAVCAAAREYEADLVVVGSHGYEHVERLQGTTAAKVVNDTDRSVLVVRRPWRIDEGAAIQFLEPPAR